jgi:hypothetical protein
LEKKKAAINYLAKRYKASESKAWESYESSKGDTLKENAKYIEAVETSKVRTARDLSLIALAESLKPAIAGEGSDSLPKDTQEKKDAYNKKIAKALKGRK